MNTMNGGFLGFTDEVKEPWKTNMEDTLNKPVRISGVAYAAKDWIINSILSGLIPEIKENCITYDRKGNENKPKKEHRLMDPKDNSFYHLNKTEYMFAKYLCEHGLDTKMSIEDYQANEAEKYKIILSQKVEEERQAKEAAEARQKENERIKKLLQDDLGHITDQEKEIVTAIFNRIYGTVNDWNFSLIPLIHNFDIPSCKAEIKSRLQNGNKASIQIFERLTGLKLPKGYKNRIAYIDKISIKDFHSDFLKLQVEENEV